ncbi:MAG: SRPBCC family protein [Anaerolineales bacterium]|nr:MAG: SRPBCC family protein [Anaerolineales bacterium]
MRTAIVVESIDIEAPRDEVFDVIANCDRRLQLSPLWGVTEVGDITSDFPHEGSSYHMKLLVEGHETEYDTIVTTFIPNQSFAYRLTVKRESRSTWSVQDVTRGTRLIYREEFLVSEDEAEHFITTARKIVCEWLENIKRYAELREERGKRLVRWLADRYYLRLRPEQRRAVIMVLALQGMSLISFVALGLGLAVASLF